MGTNFKEFEVGLKGFVEDIRTVVLANIRTMGLQALDGIVRGNPVDTGLSKGNWQVQINSPNTAQIERLDKSGQAAISDGAAIIARLQRDDELWITNNLPYILPLEEGHSQQAPTGFVAITLRQLRIQHG